MTLQRKAASAFILWHLVAISAASLPTTARVERPAGDPPPLFPRTTQVMDAAGAWISGAVSPLASVFTSAGGKPLATYISLTGLAQQWAMFSNPPQFDRYWRVRYYIQPADERLWMATELIGPAHREDRIRLLRSFRDSYQDKALEIAYDGFIKRRKPSLVAPGTRPQELPDDLAPIARYFARRFARRRITEGQQIVRTEVWVGAAVTKPLGRPLDQEVLAGRRAALLEYADGPVEDRLRVRPYPPYHGAEEEGDITWLLEYFEEP